MPQPLPGRQLNRTQGARLIDREDRRQSSQRRLGNPPQRNPFEHVQPNRQDQDEPDHERRGERPGLVAQVGDVGALQARGILLDGTTEGGFLRADGTVVYSDTLSSGESKTFRDDKRLDFVIGNAAGVELTVNGQDIGSPGGSGEVARLQFTPKDPDGTAG